MKIRRAVAATGLVLGLSLAVSGCSSAAPGGAVPGGNSGGSSNVLHLNYAGAPYSDAVLKEFKKQHPDIKVDVTHSTLTFEDGSVQTSLRSGHGADVMLVNSGPGRIAPLAKAGLIANLDKFYTSNSLADQYPKDVRDQITYDGSVYEIVEGRDIFQLYYNTKIFDKAGVKPPTTWTDLLDSCAPLAASGVQPLIVGARDNFAGGWLLGTLVQSSAGADVMHNVFFGNGAFDQKSIVQGGTRLTDLIKAGCIDGTKALALNGREAEVAFGQGKAAMTVDLEATISNLKADKLDTSSIKSMPMPSENPSNARPTSGLAVSWIVNAQTKAMPAALEWMKWVSSKEYLELAAKNGFTFAPARTVPGSVELDPAVAQAVDAAKQGSGYNPSVYLSADAKEAWYAAVQGLLGGNTAQPLMKQVDDKMKSSAKGR